MGGGIIWNFRVEKFENYEWIWFRDGKDWYGFCVY